MECPEGVVIVGYPETVTRDKYVTIKALRHSNFRYPSPRQQDSFPPPTMDTNATSVQPKPHSVQVIINPAPTRRVPLLPVLNQHFRNAGIRWDVSLTHEPGDGTRLAQEAVERGIEVVAVYGGDGTVMEVASGLVGKDVPLLILGGGTGNVVASELRIPHQLEKACEMICGDHYTTRRIDVGQVGDRYFLLRIGCGIETGAVLDATRELKDQFGKLAYVWAAIKSLQETPVAHYELTLDNHETIAVDGVACMVANVGSVGVGRLTLAPSVEVSDGKLDVFLLKEASIPGIVQLAGKMTGIDRLFRDKEEIEDPGVSLDASQMVTHWQVSSIQIKTDPPLDMQVDGDVVCKTPQLVGVLPLALRVVVAG